MFKRPNRKECFYLLVVLLLYISAVVYAYANNLSVGALFKYGLLQPKGIIGEEARLAEIETPLSWNIPQVLWFIYIKGAAVLVELFQYWIVGMFIAASLVVFVPWEKVKKKMGYGGIGANFTAASAGAVIPICSCGIVPVLAGMVEAGIPLGPTMAFLIGAPMLNVPAVFMTAGILGWKLAVGRIIGTFFIAVGVGVTLSYWQRKERFLRRFIKLSITPRLSPELQRFAFNVGVSLSGNPGRLTTEQLAPGQEEKLYLLGEAGILDRDKDGLWHLPKVSKSGKGGPMAACYVLPTGDDKLNISQRLKKLIQSAWEFFIQLNYYLVLAVIIAGAIKVLIPTNVVVSLVGGEKLNSVLISALVAVLAYVC
ncbi:MAG: permease, partial [Planctomycetota bacterium]